MKIKLGNTDMTVNRLGFGGIPIQRLTLEDSDKVVKKAMDMGINFYDSSRVYTNSEEKLGRIFSKYPRQSFYIATKTFSRDGLKAGQDLDTALTMLQTDYIDLYQLHNIANETDLDKVLAPGGALETLQNAQKQGKIRYIGITGHKPAMVLKAVKRFPFATIQVPLNYIEQAATTELIPYCRQNNIGTIAMKPVAGGAFKNVGLALRFILMNGADVIIPGMDSESQVSENLKAVQNLKPLDNTETACLEKEKETLGNEFCRRCEYCMPCPQGLPIAFLHVLRAYYFRYNLQDWVMDRLQALPKSFKDCNGCNSCRQKCPYELDSATLFKETLDKITADGRG